MDRTALGVVPGLERLMAFDRARGDLGDAEPVVAIDAGAARAAVRTVLRRARFELIPVKGALEAAVEALPAGATATVTCSPAKGLDPTIELCEDLAANGFVAVPHLAARSVRDADHLEDLLARMDEAGLRRVFVVGGDAPEPGAYPDAVALLRAMAWLGHGFDEVGVAAYPEGHVSIPTPALWRALQVKQRYAHAMVTQLCFDAAAVTRWIAEARAKGVTLPVEVGIPGPVDVGRLLRISARIGVAGAAAYLRKNKSIIGAVLRRRAFRPDPLLRELAPTIADPAAGIAGVHVYTFNQVADAVAWRDARLR